MSGDRLFSEHDLRAVLANQERRAYEEIDGIEADEFLNTSADELAEYLVTKYAVEAPVIHSEQDAVTVEHSEAQIDVSQDQLRLINDRSRPFYISGAKYTFHIPFEGDAEVLKCRPSTFSASGPPAGLVRGQEIVLELETVDPNSDAITTAVQTEMSRMQQHLGWVKGELDPFNEQLPGRVGERIAARRERLLKDRGIASSLGFQVRRRADAPRTFAVPTERRKPPIERPRPRAKTPFEPEPELVFKEYEYILDVLSNMMAVIERSPATFSHMQEEDLRQHFLVQLNGQYEGQATGETFNFQGKTDILLRADAKNIFIAECKFWDGPKTLTHAIDQLLSYASWRDTKTAIVLFNRTKNFSEVLGKIPEVMESHQNFKRELPIEGETRFRYVFAHRDDPEREIVITVLAFEVPV